MSNETEKMLVRKPLEEMDVIDNFLFNEIMANEEDGIELCRMILSLVMKREIGEIHYTPQKSVPGISETNHGIIMDTYITEQISEDGTNKPDINVYDIEPDKLKDKRMWLPRRSRYYADLIDVKLLSSGTDYDKLPDLMTIFITSYDPFGMNAMYYEAGSIVKTHPKIQYNDGIRRVFLYVHGNLPDNPAPEDRKLWNLLRYIGKSISANVKDDLTKKLDSIVRKTKADKEVGVRLVKSWEIEKEIRDAVKKEDQIIIDTERERADAAEIRADEAEKNAKLAEKDAKAVREELAKYKAKYGELK